MPQACFSIMLLIGAKFTGTEAVIGILMAVLALLLMYTGFKNTFGKWFTGVLFIFNGVVAGVWFHGNLYIIKEPVFIIYPISLTVFVASVLGIYINYSDESA